MNKSCIIIAGPTAVGKTAISLQLAKEFSTQIISADSRQCFRELNIGVAKPDWLELESIFHYFINSHAIMDSVTAADFEKYALTSVREIFKDNDTAIMVGGTGLYIKAFSEGLDLIPQTPQETRTEIISKYNVLGIDWLSNELKAKDPDYFNKGEMGNPQRMMRALEVIMSTGKSILSFQTHKKGSRNFNVIKIGLELPREDLYNSINNRVDAMITAGLVNEVERLIPFRKLNALQTVGYSELFDYFDQKTSLAEAVSLIKQHTRNYAKRQMTWFKKDKEMNWFPPDINIIKDFLNNESAK